MDSFSFTPANVFKDASTFTDPSSEEETRTQLSLPHEQTRDFINTNLVPAVNDLQSKVLALEGAVGDPEAIQQILDAIAQVQSLLSATETVAYVE